MIPPVAWSVVQECLVWRRRTGPNEMSMFYDASRPKADLTSSMFGPLKLFHFNLVL